MFRFPYRKWNKAPPGKALLHQFCHLKIYPIISVFDTMPTFGYRLSTLSALAEVQEEERLIEEEENFNEFLARMDEEYGQEEEQLTM